MIEELSAAAKQVGNELIDMSNTLAKDMQTWGDLLDQNPDSPTAKISAGFITKIPAPSTQELVIDVQAPPNEGTVLRTWAIETKIGDNQQEYFNSIQLTFDADSQQVQRLVAKGKAITREAIRLLLNDKTTRLAHIGVSNNTSGDGTKQTHGERYDFTSAELSQSPDDAAKVKEALQIVAQTLKQSVDH